jgi:hypothetical protein
MEGVIAPREGLLVFRESCQLAAAFSGKHRAGGCLRLMADRGSLAEDGCWLEARAFTFSSCLELKVTLKSRIQRAQEL